MKLRSERPALAAHILHRRRRSVSKEGLPNVVLWKNAKLRYMSCESACADTETLSLGSMPLSVCCSNEHIADLNESTATAKTVKIFMEVKLKTFIWVSLY